MTQPRARQDPVSCASCRKKKLKCDREQPCFNCTTRRVSCDYWPGIKSVGASLSRTVAVPKTDQLRDLQLENNEIKARLERLEQLIISSSNKPGLQDSSPATADGSSTGRGDEGLSFEASSTGQFGDHRPTKVRRIARADAPATVFPSPSTSMANTPDADAAKDYKGDYQWLEGVGMATTRHSRQHELILYRNAREYKAFATIVAHSHTHYHIGRDQKVCIVAGPRSSNHFASNIRRDPIAATAVYRTIGSDSAHNTLSHGPTRLGSTLSSPRRRPLCGARRNGAPPRHPYKSRLLLGSGTV